MKGKKFKEVNESSACKAQMPIWSLFLSFNFSSPLPYAIIYSLFSLLFKVSFFATSLVLAFKFLPFFVFPLLLTFLLIVSFQFPARICWKSLLFLVVRLSIWALVRFLTLGLVCFFEFISIPFSIIALFFLTLIAWICWKSLFYWLFVWALELGWDSWLWVFVFFFFLIYFNTLYSNCLVFFSS